jgi:hypothetical protein
MNSLLTTLGLSKEDLHHARSGAKTLLTIFIISGLLCYTLFFALPAGYQMAQSAAPQLLALFMTLLKWGLIAAVALGASYVILVCCVIAGKIAYLEKENTESFKKFEQKLKSLHPYWTSET